MGHVKLREALEAVLLFHGANWNQERVVRWRAITGQDEATTRVLCDTVRAALAAPAEMKLRDALDRCCRAHVAWGMAREQDVMAKRHEADAARRELLEAVEAAEARAVPVAAPAEAAGGVPREVEEAVTRLEIAVYGGGNEEGRRTALLSTIARAAALARESALRDVLRGMLDGAPAGCGCSACARARALLAPAAATPKGLTFDDALRIAHGCTDYGGGHHSDGMMDAYQHGIQTVINALAAAGERGLADTQILALHRMGAPAAATESQRTLQPGCNEPPAASVASATERCSDEREHEEVGRSRPAKVGRATATGCCPRCECSETDIRGVKLLCRNCDLMFSPPPSERCGTCNGFGLLPDAPLTLAGLTWSPCPVCRSPPPSAGEEGEGG